MSTVDAAEDDGDSGAEVADPAADVAGSLPSGAVPAVPPEVGSPHDVRARTPTRAQAARLHCPWWKIIRMQRWTFAHTPTVPRNRTGWNEAVGPGAISAAVSPANSSLISTIRGQSRTMPRSFAAPRRGLHSARDQRPGADPTHESTIRSSCDSGIIPLPSTVSWKSDREKRPPRRELAARRMRSISNRPIM